MKKILFKILFFPLDLLYLTIDAWIITWRTVRRIFKKQKQQKCHLCQGESHQESGHQVRSVLKYQNKWMVKLLAPCIHFKQDGKRTIGFCQQEGYMTRPPRGVPLLALGLLCFWLFGSYAVLRGLSSDPEHFAQNFISTFLPSTLGDTEEDPNFLTQSKTQLNPERADRYYLAGVKAFDKGDYPSAQVDFKIAIQSNPTKANYHFYLAKAYRAMGQNVQAENSVRDTLGYDPEYVEAMLMQAEFMESREDRAGAMKLAEKALTLEPNNLQVIRMNAGLLAASGEKEKTRELMKQLYVMNGTDPATLTFLGRLELSVFQDLDTAKARLQSALEKQENYIPAMLAMVSVYAQEKDLDKVDDTLNKILELEPDNLQAMRLQAEMTLSRYGISAGLRAYNKLLNRFGGNLDLRLRYTELLLRAGKISEGKDLAEQLAQSRIPQYERAAHWMLAQLYSQVRMYKDAVQQGRSTLRLTPNNQSSIHLFLAQQLMALNELSEARREAEAALAQNREDLRAVNLLTQAMVMQDKTNEAVTLLDNLIKEFPDSDALRMRRIEILMQSERWREALPDTRMLNEKYADNAALQNNLAFLLARSGEDLAKADTLSEALMTQFADNPIIMDTRAYVLAAEGKHEEALKVYETALSKARENVVIRYHYAVSLAALQRTPEAITQLQALLMINPNFPQAAEARDLLRSLTGEDG